MTSTQLETIASPDPEILGRGEVERYLFDEGNELDDRIERQLRAMGILVGGVEPPRSVATKVINKFTRENADRALQLFAQLWMQEGDYLTPDECEAPDSRLGSIDPREIRELITKQLYNLYVQGRFAEARQLLKAYDAKDPRGYIAHMDEMTGGHGKATSDAFAAYQSANGLSLAGPYVEVGAGPGKITWDFVRRGLINPEERITLVEPNEDWAQFAKGLVGRIAQRVNVLTQGGESFRLEEPAQTISSALCLQWITGEGVLAKILDNGIQNLEVGGRWFDAGEMPEDVFGTTVQAVEKGLDIGFEGAYGWSQMARMFEERGMVPDPKSAVCRIAMPSPSERLLSSLDPEQKQIALLAEAMNDHMLVGAGWVRAR